MSRQVEPVMQTLSVEAEVFETPNEGDRGPLIFKQHQGEATLGDGSEIQFGSGIPGGAIILSHNKRTVVVGVETVLRAAFSDIIERAVKEVRGE